MGVSLQTGLINEKNGNHGIAFGGEFSDGIVSNTRFFGLNLLKEMKYASILLVVMLVTPTMNTVRVVT